jgi:hypothetical protein
MNPIYEQLLQNAIVLGNGPLIVRFGGDGAIQQNLATSLPIIAQLNKDLGVQFLVAVDFVDNNSVTAAIEASEIAGALPAGALKAIEMGNEPDLYLQTAPSSVPANWNYSEYLSQYQTLASAVLNVTGGVKLGAPVFSGAGAFGNALNSFIEQ